MKKLIKFILSCLGFKIRRPYPSLNNTICHLEIPLNANSKLPWKMVPQFRGKTPNLNFISCHVSILKKGQSPHLPHAHDEEEILLLLYGQIEVIIADDQNPAGLQRIRLNPGEFMYYPATYQHTLETVSDEPANYVMFKWYNRKKTKNPILQKGHFRPFREPLEIKDLSRLFTRLVLEGPSLYCKKLHIHESILKPGVGYRPHADDHDVAMIILQGEVETIQQRAKPFDILFFPAGKKHGMRNSGKQEVRYLVFEFHGSRLHFSTRKIRRLGSKMVHYKNWKRKYQKLFGNKSG